MRFTIGFASGHRTWTAALILSCQLLLRPAYAQETINFASLSGRVVDPQAAVVPGPTCRSARSTRISSASQ